MPLTIEASGANPEWSRDEDLLDQNAQPEAEVYHKGLDERGEPAIPPPLTGDEMDEVGW
jgi:hypothetical protein